MGGEKLKWRQLAHHQLMSKPKTSFNLYSTAKTNDKSTISGRMICSGIRHVAITSVHSEKTRLKKLIMIIIIMITEKPFTSK